MTEVFTPFGWPVLLGVILLTVVCGRTFGPRGLVVVSLVLGIALGVLVGALERSPGLLPDWFCASSSGSPSGVLAFLSAIFHTIIIMTVWFVSVFVVPPRSYKPKEPTLGG